MRGVILAAGRGSRMGDLTDERPKCLVEIAGRSLLSRQINALTAAGVDDIAVVTGYRAESIAPYVPTTFHNERWAETNMVRSLDAAREWLSGSPVIVSYSDIFFQAEAVAALIGASDPIAISYDVNWRSLWERRFDDPLTDAETFKVSGDGYLKEIGGKPETLDEVEGQYMGLLHFTPEGWGWVTDLLGTMSDLEIDRLDMTALISRLIGAGREIAAVPTQLPWGEADNAGDVALYESGLDAFQLQ